VTLDGTDTHVGVARTQTDRRPPQFVVLELLSGMWVARALHVAADLGIADLLHHGPRPVGELAAVTGTDPETLHRLLRALTTVGVFSEHSHGIFAQTPASAVLETDHPNSVRAAARLFGADWQWEAWSHLQESVRAGHAAFQQSHGRDLVDFLDDENNQEARALFDGAMSDMSRMLNRALLTACDVTDATHVAAVSGGHSGLLQAILASHPHMRGTLVDRPSVVRRWVERLAVDPVRARLDLIEADLPREVPRDPHSMPWDRVLLDRVLHDWDDAQALELLRRCREHLPAHGRLLLIEQLVTADDRRVAFLDLQMLVTRGGRERSVEEYRELLAAAGLQLDKVVSTYSPMTVLEAVPDHPGHQL
jgi:hypothetical protein